MNVVSIKQPPQTARVGAVDGLRAIAMTMVIAQHCGLMPFGWVGVWLFFVISGYVITRGFIQGSYQGVGWCGTLRVFVSRRAQRIVPVYLLYLAVGTIVLVAAGGQSRLVDLPYLISFTYNWHMAFEFWPGLGNWGPFGHLWTLSVEQQFYLLFPLIALLVPAHRQVAVCSIIVALGPLIRWLGALAIEGTFAGQPGPQAFALYVATPCHIDAFLMGAVVARLEPRLASSRLVPAALSATALGVATAYAFTYVLINIQVNGAAGVDALRNVVSGVLWGQHREVLVYLAVDLVAVAALVHVLCGRPGSGLLAIRPLAWVGRVSYGGYLYHALVIWFATEWLFSSAPKDLPVMTRVAEFGGVWIVTVALASASFVWFEAPVARWWAARSRISRNERAFTARPLQT